MRKSATILIAGAIVVLLGLMALRAVTFGKRTTVDVVAVTPDAGIDTEAAAQHLSGAVAIPTVVSGDSAAIDSTVFRQLHTYLAAAFPAAHDRLEREVVSGLSLLYTWQGAEPGLPVTLLLAHQDVVPVAPETTGQWTYPPFSGAVSDGFVWGRGAIDDKASLCAILEAVTRLDGEGFSPRRTIIIAVGHDEEMGGADGAAHIAELLEERGVRAHCAVDEGGMIVADVLPEIEKPAALVGIAEKGYLSLELVARGTGGHSAVPPRHTAVGKVARAVTRLEANPFPTRLDFAAALLEYIAPELPFHRRLVFGNLWAFGPVVTRTLAASRETNTILRTTLAATMAKGGVKDNVLPETARAVVNFRILPGETVAAVTDRVRSIVDDSEVEIRQYAPATEPSAVSDIEGPAYAALVRAIYETGGTEILVVPSLTVGTTDSRHYARIADNTYRFMFAIFGPEDIARVHGVNERLSLENYARLVTFYKQLIRNLNVSD